MLLPAVHEVVEVDGFVFKRKRRTILGESAGAEPAKRPREEHSGACTSGEPSVQAPAAAAAPVDARPQVAPGCQALHPAPSQPLLCNVEAAIMECVVREAVLTGDGASSACGAAGSR